jgi:hypothetical protein
MKDQIVMAANGEIAVAVPLFRLQHEEALEHWDGYILSVTNSKPLAYVLDVGDPQCTIFKAEFIEKNVEFLGDL